MNGRRFRRTPKGGAPRKHRAAHLDDVTYAIGCDLASARSMSFSEFVGELILAEHRRRSQVTETEEE